jgi:hypothetical protein
MSALHKDIAIDAPATEVWDAIRDVGRPHERITPGVLTDASFDGTTRTVTFADGFVATERIVDVDDDRRRLAYAVVGGPFEHHHATMQVVENGPDASRVVWITDLLPAEMVPVVSVLVDAGSDAMQRTLGVARPTLEN